MREDIQSGRHPDADQLSAFIEGVVPEHERVACLAHLADCSDCRQIVFLMREPLTERKSTVSAPIWRRRFVLTSIYGGALAACALLIIVSWHFQHASALSKRNQAILRLPAQTEPQSPSNVREQSRSGTSTSRPETGTQAHSRILSGPPVDSSSANIGAASTPSPSLMKGAGPSPAVSPQAPLARFGEPAQLRSEAAGTRGRGTVTGLLAQKDTTPRMAGVESLDLEGRSSSRLLSPGGDLTVSIEHNHGPASEVSEFRGTVTDTSGAVIPKAAVTLRQAGGTASGNAATDANGQFELSALPAGRYELMITAPGFQAVSRQIELESHDLALLRSTLPVSGAAQTVTVQAVAPPIENEAAELHSINSPQLEDQFSSAPLLPNRQPASQSVEQGNRILAVDQTGTLYFSPNAGKDWKAIKPRWQGKVASVRITTEPQSDVALERQRADEPPAPGGAAGSDVPGRSFFELTTDSGVAWRSEDGLHWHSAPPSR
jgi:Carboxypeptidase regulatory-like domain/Putative zinc-finger